MSIGLGVASMLVSLAGNVASAVLSKKSNDRTSNAIQKQGLDDDLWYSRKMNEDPTTNKQYALLLNKAKERQDEQMNTNRARAKVTGGTTEQLLAQESDLNKQYADIVGGVLSKQQEIQNATGEAWRNARRENQNNLLKLEEQKQQSYANLAKNSANLMASGIKGMGSSTDKSVNNNLNISDEYTDSIIKDPNKTANSGIDELEFA